MKNEKILKLLAVALSFTPFVALAQDDSSSGWALPTTFNLPSGTVTDIVKMAGFWILALLGVLGVIGFVIAGIMYLLSGGDDTRITKAKKAMVASIVGVAVGLAGIVIMKAIETALGGQSSAF